MMTQHYVQYGPQQLRLWHCGSGPPLLFLHGGRVEARTFQALLTHLGQYYSVTAPDLPGYGASPTPITVWSYTDYASCLVKLLDDQISQPVTVIGYSMGGAIAMHLALASSLVERLVLIDSAGCPLSLGRTSHRDGSRAWFYLRHPAHWSAGGNLVASYGRFLWQHRFDMLQLRRIRRHCRLDMDHTSPARLQVATSIIWGRQDTIFPLSAGRALHKQIKGSRLHIVSGTHDWPVYDPSLLEPHMI